ncbi:PTS IIA-like nitrogen-regulatory protein PtsN [Maridesulfovibrio ferrireducens]|uniref:PTS IIA-like nitrogen-regulatory protein PtsN n=1 Tax=Maridesulfovibrio ferrireducens TaxID=246191 RepID=A0A1G9E721_9BACT|nr:PTS sugar transporter subunit IIA [Maridesulfovibrio ferrireducens]SDK71946.1 PTS IIA-like nitrogen-regulatory protein PtsN [Maridesulfovibrio ferrireducens]
MIINDNLDKDLVIYELESSDKSGVLREMVTALKATGLELDVESALQVLMSREKLGTTGIGDGIAIPHGKLDCLENIAVVVGRSGAGVNFEALDAKPCQIFFMVLAPEQGAGSHLKVLAQISRQLKDNNFRDAFINAQNPQDLLTLLNIT